MCHRYLQVGIGSDQKQSRKYGNTVFAIISIWDLFPDAEGQLIVMKSLDPSRTEKIFIRRRLGHTAVSAIKSNRKAMNRNWSNQKANPALKTKAGNI